MFDIMLDNVLSKEQLKIAFDEIKKNRKNMINDSKYASYRRWYPKDYDKVSGIFDSAIFSKTVRDMAKDFEDLSWRWLVSKISTKYEVQVTSYKKSLDNKYDWHVDHDTSELRTLNCILYLTDVSKGGELQIADKIDGNILKKIKPVKNRLVMIPSWYVHRVTPIDTSEERLSLNGHIVMAEEGFDSHEIWK